MTANIDKVNALTAFIQADKFGLREWGNRGLNPSDNEMCKFLQDTFNDIAEELKSTILADKKSSSLKPILKAGLRLFPNSAYDTEEKEFICDTFNTLAKIIDVDFASTLNKWLYGSLLSALLKIGKILNPEKIIYTLQQPCNKCGIELETHVNKIEQGIPDTNWFIVKCNNCKALNLLTLEPDIKGMKFGNYELVENLFKQDYTYEQAQIRLEQITTYRK
ncbi:DUF4844 domain-containing protein [Mucilaginibacter phyllosphaerae]|uniref:DUF4844 domain-containing protein n=1 Tax=Mucilaginibacter phyllosphaerae TaxID=1812349 RepID=A0A4Y8AGS2_9SPHI|nr:DUF4844 domain-containing protein [Mucilaginibacter phyllosphaerae]MBB3968979.1 hypothetical protein [Mucilaginibacter phyllosphaerae]TEW67399.1 DUF4844 domain-containing protein [Mucilaginibacter phyllosphaerae]GGH23165.1 hypothetical protein GCM10007352_36920 [Mucilaginibacter phyllosphaerae]